VNKVQESIQMNGDKPVAFRTSCCQQETGSTKIDGYEGRSWTRYKSKQRQIIDSTTECKDQETTEHDR
jgi:hypothetical protein